MTITLSQILHSFFEDHLKLQKGLQPTSIRSYRDTVRLFLCHVAQDQRRRITQIRLQDLTFEQTQRFLQHLEVDRHNHVQTRNQRLCALRTFFDYVAYRVPEMLDRKSTRLNSSHLVISYAVFCLKKKNKNIHPLSV